MHDNTEPNRLTEADRRAYTTAMLATAAHWTRRAWPLWTPTPQDVATLVHIGAHAIRCDVTSLRHVERDEIDTYARQILRYDPNRWAAPPVTPATQAHPATPKKGTDDQ